VLALLAVLWTACTGVGGGGGAGSSGGNSRTAPGTYALQVTGTYTGALPGLQRQLTLTLKVN